MAKILKRTYAPSSDKSKKSSKATSKKSTKKAATKAKTTTKTETTAKTGDNDPVEAVDIAGVSVEVEQK